MARLMAGLMVGKMAGLRVATMDAKKVDWKVGKTAGRLVVATGDLMADALGD